jgi:hypothetical protein
MIDIAFDDTLGILRCVSRGVTSGEELAQFGPKAVPLLARARMRSGRCLILVDAIATAVHSQETAAAFSAMTAHLRSEDRTAIIIGSAIAKLQSQRLAVKEASAYFATEPEAIAWLLGERA